MDEHCFNLTCSVRLFCLMCLGFCAGCHLFKVDPEDASPGLIDFGRSINGIEIEDDSATVIRTLGSPSKMGIGDYDGYTFVYAIDGSDAIDVTISHDPALGTGVISMSIFSVYPGMTEGGIGIGSPRGETLKALGAPDVTEDSPQSRRDIYQFEHSSFSVEYRNDKIYSISMTRRMIFRVPDQLVHF